MRTTQIMCDACGEVLKGTNGTTFVNKDSLGIRGIVTFFSENDHTFITRHANEELSFCGVDCFKEFCNRRLMERHKERESSLRREATDRIVYNQS